MAQLHEVSYGWGSNTPSGEGGKAAYLLQDDRCVFSGVKRPATSTINDAERIINRIAEAERIDPRGVVFYDFCTSRGYMSYEQGEEKLLKLAVRYDSLRKAIGVTSWEEISSDPSIVSQFKQLLNAQYPIG